MEQTLQVEHTKAILQGLLEVQKSIVGLARIMGGR